MALPQSQFEDLDANVLLGRYLRALKRYGQPEPKASSPGHAIRSCARCGRHTIFRMDPEGTWFECSVCGSYA